MTLSDSRQSIPDFINPKEEQRTEYRGKITTLSHEKKEKKRWDREREIQMVHNREQDDEPKNIPKLYKSMKSVAISYGRNKRTQFALYSVL